MAGGWEGQTEGQEDERTGPGRDGRGVEDGQGGRWTGGAGGDRTDEGPGGRRGTGSIWFPLCQSLGETSVG